MVSSRKGLLSIVLLAVPAVVLAEEKQDSGKLRLIRTLEQPGRLIASVCFTPDGNRMVTSGGRSVHLWDPATGKELARFRHPKAEHAGLVALAPDGKTVAACFGTGWEIMLLDIVSGQVQHRLRHDHIIYGLAFAPDGKTLISTGGADRTARLWEVATGKELRLMRLRYPATGKEVDPKQPRPPNESTSTFGVAFSPDGKIVAVGVQDGSIRLCDPATGAETRRLFHEDDNNCEVYFLSFSPDGRFLAAGGVHFKVGARLWDVTTGKAVREFRLPPRPGFFGPEASDRALEEREKIERQMPAQVQALSFSPDGKTLAIARACGGGQEVTPHDKVWLWEVATGRARHQVSLSTYILAFCPTGALAAISKEYALVNLWDWRDPYQEQPKRLEPKDIDRLWANLAAEDAATGYQAIATLRAVPQQAVEALAQHLRPVEPVTNEQLDRLVAELNDESFSTRERACRKLELLGEAARPALQGALAKKPSLEVKLRIEQLLSVLDGPIVPARLRCLRAIEVLESIGTEEARRVLQKLADGAPRALETEDARAALKRLTRK